MNNLHTILVENDTYKHENIPCLIYEYMFSVLLIYYLYVILYKVRLKNYCINRIIIIL